jgi:hypothetical protein
MSGINGDKSRFHRVRKQKIARRLRKQELLAGQTAPKAVTSAPAARAASGKEDKVSA